MDETENVDSLSENPIDFERLRDIADNDAELMDELIELYFPQTRELLDELKIAIETGNYDSIYKSAHKALGSSVTCGMNAIVQHLKELEQYGRDKNSENAHAELTRAERAFKEMTDYLQANREQLSA